MLIYWPVLKSSHTDTHTESKAPFEAYMTAPRRFSVREKCLFKSTSFPPGDFFVSVVVSLTNAKWRIWGIFYCFIALWCPFLTVSFTGASCSKCDRCQTFVSQTRALFKCKLYEIILRINIKMYFEVKLIIMLQYVTGYGVKYFRRMSQYHKCLFK